MRYLVTGGAGFLGSHLCESLLEDGHEVLAVDNLYTGSKANIRHLYDNSNFEFMRHDITFPLFVEVDAIFNLACPASPVHYQKFPVQTLKTSVVGSINMLGLAKRLQIPILQASTSEVYGDPEISPQHESYWGNVNPIGPRSCYDEGKRAAESLFFDYQRQFNVDVKVARIFNTYGPRMALNDGRIISNFIFQAIQNLPITIYGNGSQTRSFCFVSDLIIGLKCLMNTNRVEGPVNLGNDQELSILEVADRVVKAIGSTSIFEHLELPIDDPKQRKPDLARAKTLLNWQAQESFDSGLQKTIENFQVRMQA